MAALGFRSTGPTTTAADHYGRPRAAGHSVSYPLGPPDNDGPAATSIVGFFATAALCQREPGKPIANNAVDVSANIFKVVFLQPKSSKEDQQKIEQVKRSNVVTQRFQLTI